nr:hypothetical protein [Priestia megaterium]
MSVGFYEVGTDIPAGTYTLEINDSEVYNDFAYVTIYQKAA